MQTHPSIGAQLHAQLPSDHALLPVAQAMLLDRLNTADRALHSYRAVMCHRGLALTHPEVQAHIRIRLERLEQAQDEAAAAGLISILLEVSP